MKLITLKVININHLKECTEILIKISHLKCNMSRKGIIKVDIYYYGKIYIM